MERLEKEFVDMDIDGVRTEGADHMDVDTGAVKTKGITASMTSFLNVTFLVRKKPPVKANPLAV